VLVRRSGDVSVHWGRTDGASIPSDSRISRLDYNTRLQIAQLQRSDEGAYSCTGSDSATGTTVFAIQLFVHGQASSIEVLWLRNKSSFEILVFQLESMMIYRIIIVKNLV